MADPTRAGEPGPASQDTEAAAPEQEAALPPLECVRRVRDARIADAQGHHDLAIGLLKVALRTCGDALSPVAALLEHNAVMPLPEGEVQTYREILRARLQDLARPLPPSLLRFVIDSPNLAPEELEMVLQAAKAQAGPEADRLLLEAIVALERKLDRPADARRTLADMLQRWDEPFLRWRCILLDIELERWADAVPLLRRELASVESTPSVLPLYVKALIASGDWQEAAKQLADLQRRVGADGAARTRVVEILVEAGWAARDAGHAQASEAAFRRALEIDPRSTSARGAILYLYAGAGERQALLEAARRAVTSVTIPEDLYSEGMRSLAAGDAEGARSLFLAAAEADPEYEAAWFHAGVAALRLERWEDAEDALSRAAALRPDRTAARTLRGIALRSLGRCDAAIELLLGVVALDDGEGDAWRTLALCYEDLGRPADADEARRRAEAAAAP